MDKKQSEIWQKEYMKHQERLLELKSAYMLDCKDVRGDMSDVLDRAKDAGIPKYAIRKAAKIMELEARIKDLKEGGEPEENETLEQHMHALGMLADTPLGRAATEKKAKGMPGASAAASSH